MCMVAECMEMARGFCDSQTAPIEITSKWSVESLMGGIMWVLRTGAQWRALPKEFPPKSTVHRWFQRLTQTGVFLDVLKEWVSAFYSEFKPKDTCYVDGMFAEAKSGGDGVGKTKCGKGTKIMVITNDDLIPMAVQVESANPHELTLLNLVLDSQILPECAIRRLVGDGAYDSDKHDAALRDQRSIELLAPHKRNRVHRTQDGRKMKIYKRRHKVENLNAHLQNYRRVVTRYEKKLSNFLGILHLACWSIVFNKIYAVM